MKTSTLLLVGAALIAIAKARATPMPTPAAQAGQGSQFDGLAFNFSLDTTGAQNTVGAGAAGLR